MQHPNLIKICGLREPSNIKEIANLGPDYLGFIFHSVSKRSVSPAEFSMPDLPLRLKTVGVFVDAPLNEVISIQSRYKLSAVQLHGNESPLYVKKLRLALPEVEIFKAVPIDNQINFEILMEYESFLDLFIFDSRKDNQGHSNSFSWGLLSNYPLNRPYLLAGGLDALAISEAYGLLKDTPISGFDLNSRIEVSPGVKSESLARTAITVARGLERSFNSG